jgi:hypothetical protein
MKQSNLGMKILQHGRTIAPMDAATHRSMRVILEENSPGDLLQSSAKGPSTAQVKRKHGKLMRSKAAPLFP